MSDTVRKWLLYIITGVEDGWIKVDQKVWRQYLLAKELLNEAQRTN